VKTEVADLWRGRSLVKSVGVADHEITRIAQKGRRDRDAEGLE
jgi:hypothetical protein